MPISHDSSRTRLLAFWLLVLGAAACFVSARPLRADTLRVTSLNLLGATNTSVVSESAEALKRLDPDIILLQGVKDWKFCYELSALLKPSQYFVLICSAFSGDSANNQAAVLSKYKGYFSWAQSWGTETLKQPGGFVFAALDVKGRKAGFFSAVLGQSYDPALLQPLLEQARTAANWEANRVQAMSIALGVPSGFAASTTSNIVANLTQQGYSDAFAAFRFGAAERSSAVADWYLVQSSIFPDRPTLSQILSSSHSALTCDLELDPAKAASGWTGRAEELQRLAAENLKRQQSLAEAERNVVQTPVKPASESWQRWSLIAGGFVLLAVGCGVFLSRRPIRTGDPRLIPENLEHAMTYTVVVDSPAGPASTVVNSVLPDESASAWQQRAVTAEAKAAQANYVLRKKLSGKLADWLKQKFIARLVSERKQMLATQQDAALRAINVDERLAKIESQIQLQTRNYQQKIDELTLELQAAREENRELIRARIAQVKLEMEAVRARMMAEARAQQQTD